MNIRIPIFMLLITSFASYWGCVSYSVSRPYLFGWHSEEGEIEGYSLPYPQIILPQG